MNTLRDLFLNELAEAYDSERRIIKALSKFINAATCTELKDALQRHLHETEDQAEKLEKVFAAFDERPRSKKCPAINGLLEEGDQIVSDNLKSPTINAAIIAATQKVEHYEIASYGCLHTWADLLDNPEAATYLEEILEEEKAADRMLNELATSKNEEALAGAGVGHHRSDGEN